MGATTRLSMPFLGLYTCGTQEGTHRQGVRQRGSMHCNCSDDISDMRTSNKKRLNIRTRQGRLSLICMCMYCLMTWHTVFCC